VKKTPLLNAINLTRSFEIGGRKIVALDNVSMTVNHGEIIGIVGNSGAGKSTLLQLLGALDHPSDGRVMYLGEDIYKMNDSLLALFRSRSIGFVFQAGNLLPEFSAEENVALAAMIAGNGKKLAIDKARVQLIRMGLSNRLNHRPGKLSGGEQQRVAIARALVNEPDIVLADEPTGNLDTSTSKTIMKMIHRLTTEQNMAFVVVTHNLLLTDNFTKVVKIKDGRFVDNAQDVLE
tara:strand:- start:66639 stop:67340 length:702 start_codon:yes stop_codon:yes gene_type:complete